MNENYNKNSIKYAQLSDTNKNNKKDIKKDEINDNMTKGRCFELLVSDLFKDKSYSFKKRLYKMIKFYFNEEFNFKWRDFVVSDCHYLNDGSEKYTIFDFVIVVKSKKSYKIFIDVKYRKNKNEKIKKSDYTDDKFKKIQKIKILNDILVNKKIINSQNSLDPCKHNRFYLIFEGLNFKKNRLLFDCKLTPIE